VRFGDIDDEKSNFVFIVLVELIEGGNLPPEGWSSVASEDEYDRALLRGELGDANLCGLVELDQGKIWRRVAYLQAACAGMGPQGFKGKDQECDRPWDSSHEAGKSFGRLLHNAVQDSAGKDPQEGQQA